MYGKIYLNVPYSGKDSAKAIGAKWDSKIKKWYYSGNVDNYIKFAKWIACGREDTTIALNYLYIIEGIRNCFHCKKPTRVIGLGYGEHMALFRNDDEYKYSITENQEDYKPLSVTWVNEKEDIPPVILRYIQQKYNVHMGYSKIAGKNFANHCDHCQNIQGNFHLFCEDKESPLTFFFPDESAILKLSKLKIYPIKIETSLVIDWDFCLGNYSPLYLRYGKIQNPILLSSKNDFITYEELFEL